MQRRPDPSGRDWETGAAEEGEETDATGDDSFLLKPFSENDPTGQNGTWVWAEGKTVRRQGEKVGLGRLTCE